MVRLIREIGCPGNVSGRRCNADLWPMLATIEPGMHTVQVVCPICTHTVTIALTWATVEAIVEYTAMAEMHKREEAQ